MIKFLRLFFKEKPHTDKPTHEPFYKEWNARTQVKQKGPLRLTYQGKTQKVSAWSNDLGISANTIRNRLKKGCTVEEALDATPRVKDLTGKRFGRLTVTSRAENYDHPKVRYSRWNCVCDCGNSTVSLVHNLTNGRSKSCGCEKGRNPGKNYWPEIDAMVREGHPGILRHLGLI